MCLVRRRNIYIDGCRRRGSEKSLQYLTEIKIELIQYGEIFLQYKYITELNNKKNTTASTEIILGWRHYAAEVNFSISRKQLSQPNSTSTQPQLELEWLHNDLDQPTPPRHPWNSLGHFQATQEADFRYATLFWPN